MEENGDMFTNIKLKNFKSFKNVEIDFQSKKGKSKPLIIIYGENGSGKTTISQAFLAQMCIRDRDAIESAFADEKDKVTTEEILNAIENTHSLSEIMKDALDKMAKEYEDRKFRNASKQR